MKPGKTKVLTEIFPATAVDFVGGTQPTQVGGAYEVIGGGTAPHGDFVQLKKVEVLDVSGLQANDLSMTAQGTGVMPIAPYFKTDTGHPIDVRDICIVTTYPVPDTDATVTDINIGDYYRSTIDKTRTLLCSVSDYAADPAGGFNLVNRGMSAWSGASSFSTDRIYLYRYLIISMRPFYDITTSLPYPIAGSQGRLNVPGIFVSSGIELEEFNAVQTAYAVYRANDLQQSFDNP